MRCCAFQTLIFYLLASILLCVRNFTVDLLLIWLRKAARSNVEAGVCEETIEMEMTQDDIDFIVELHNQLRQRVASGKEYRGSPGPQPPAFYMPDLV